MPSTKDFESPKTKEGYVIPSFVFIGPLGVGKTTYSDYLKFRLEKECEVTIYRPSFSKKIEEIAKDLFGMEEYNRSLMQGIGNKMRELDAGVWAKHIIKDIKANGRLPMICDGLRKPEELEVFKDELKDFVVIRLEADEKKMLQHYKEKFGKYPTKEQMSNAAEESISILHADMTLFNNYDPQELDRQIGEMVKAIKTNSIQRLIDMCKPGIVYRQPWDEEFVRHGKFSNPVNANNWRKLEEIIADTTEQK